jgi:outer membrane protein assembly factor BamB
MLDHQAARRLRQGAHAACALIGAALACAAPARAQGIPVVSPPATPPPAPGAETPFLGGDAAHRNFWQGTGLRPPLELAWQADATPAAAPVAVGSRVVVASANVLTAYDAGNGTPVWNVALDAPVELATDGTRVFLASGSGVAARSLADGELVWDRPGPAATGPTAADGRLVVGSAGGGIVAYNAVSGTQAWSAPTAIAGARPAIAGSRVYVTGRCSAAAVSATTGLPIWTAGSCLADTGTRTLLGGPFVLAEDAGMYAAADGTIVTPGPAPGTIGAGVLFLSPLPAEQRELEAIDAGSFRRRWTWTPPLPGRLLLRPAAVDESIWQVVDAGDEGLVLAAINAGTGAERWTGFLPVGDGQGELVPEVTSAVAALPGLLLVPTDGGGLAALRNAPSGPLGVTATVPRNVYAAGANTKITGTLTGNGHGLVGPRRVVLEADTFPFGRQFETEAATTSGRGGFSFPVTIARNTRYRFQADGVTYPPTTIYAEPALTVTYAHTSRRRVVQATLRVAQAEGLRRRGARVGIYRRKPGARVLTRLGRGVTQRGGVAVFRVRIPRSLPRTDRIYTCMRGASRQGFGFPDVLDRHCGNRRIALPAQAARRNLRSGTMADDDPTTEELLAVQAQRQRDEETKEHEAVQPEEAQAARRRADKAAYLRDKLAEQRDRDA